MASKAKIPANFRETANTRYEDAKKFWRNWRMTARDDFAFVAGNQWLADDEQLLIAQKRPPITFNYSEKMIDAVVGAEVSSRQEVTYAPREISDAPLAELWTNAAKWVRDESNIEDEESDAFRDDLICGMGWTHTKVSFETDTDGMVEVHRVDPLEMLADPAARKPGLIDRRYSFREQWVDTKVAKQAWPNQFMLGADHSEILPGMDMTSGAQGYQPDQGGADADSPETHKDQVRILHYECVELMPMYRVATETGTMDIEASDFSDMKAGLDERGIQYVKMNKRTYFYGYFAGDTLLEAGLSPTQEGFTYGCMTGKRDRNTNTWYGLTRVMKDPQRWANKWLSQILHIINSNAKGGLLAEIGAFVDPKRAQDEWASPESITMLKEGAIGKIKEKEQGKFPAGLDKLMEFALASLPQVTGINLEALGLAGREQANVLEQSRKQAAYGLLAPVFDALRRYRKSQGRVLLDFIDKYISDGRMIRIGGPESKNFIPLTKAPKAIRYDIIVDQSPQAPDVKRETWSVLENLIPAAMKAGMPIPPTILKYAPIPTMLALEWQQHASKQQVSPEQVQQLQQEMQKMQQQLQQKDMQLKSKQEEMQMKRQEMVAGLQLEIQKLQFEFRAETAKLQQELQIERAKADVQMQIQREKSDHEMQMRKSEVEGGIDVAMTEAVTKGSNEASANIMKAINDLVAKIGKLENEAETSSE